VIEMTWTIAALLVLDLAAVTVAIRRVPRRLLTLAAILDVDRELLDELAQLFLSDEITTARRDSSAGPRVEREIRGGPAGGTDRVRDRRRRRRGKGHRYGRDPGAREQLKRLNAVAPAARPSRQE
jgi:hypothetical protein